MGIVKKNTFYKNCRLAIKQGLTIEQLAIVNAFRDLGNLDGLREYLSFSREDVQEQTITKMVTDLNAVIDYCTNPYANYLVWFEQDFGLSRNASIEQRINRFFPHEPEEPERSVFDSFLLLCRMIVEPFLVVATTDAHQDERTTPQSRNTCRIYFRPNANWKHTPEGRRYLREHNYIDVREENLELLTLDALYNHVSDFVRSAEMRQVEEELAFFDLRSTLHLEMSETSGVTEWNERLQENVPYGKYLSSSYVRASSLVIATQSMLSRWMSLLIYDNDVDRNSQNEIYSSGMIKFQQKLSDEGYTTELNQNERNSPLLFDSDLIQQDLTLHEFFFTLRLTDIWNSSVDFYTLLLLPIDSVSANIYQEPAVAQNVEILFNFDRNSRRQQIREFHRQQEQQNEEQVEDSEEGSE